MKSLLRACGFAAAAIGCLVAATTAEPTIAAAFDGAEVSHSAIDEHDLAQITDAVMDMADTASPRLRSLEELVKSDYRARITDAEQECLANAVYFEARSEPLQGQLAVADVVINRANSGKYPKTLCEVITQPWQFSFIEDGKFPEADRSSAAWRKAVAVADVALTGYVNAVKDDVLWYHADYVAPVWRKRLDREKKIGLHIFYS